MRRRVPDIDKVRNALGWEPTKSLDDIILDVKQQQLESSRLGALAA
jgi:hypothetical protein